MGIEKSKCGKMAVPSKEPQSQFYPYVLFVSQIKKITKKPTLQWIIHIMLKS